MRAVQHENVDVRIHALTSLKDTIYKKQVRNDESLLIIGGEKACVKIQY